MLYSDWSISILLFQVQERQACENYLLYINEDEAVHKILNTINCIGHWTWAFVSILS